MTIPPQERFDDLTRRCAGFIQLQGRGYEACRYVAQRYYMESPSFHSEAMAAAVLDSTEARKWRSVDGRGKTLSYASRIGALESRGAVG